MAKLGLKHRQISDGRFPINWFVAPAKEWVEDGPAILHHALGSFPRARQPLLRFIERKLLAFDSASRPTKKSGRRRLPLGKRLKVADDARGAIVDTQEI